METLTLELHGRDLPGQIRAACLLEATARKPGNVHPQARFDTLSFTDFIAAADACAPILAHAHSNHLGAAILQAVRASRTVTQSNTNLGIVLLLAPLAAAGEALDVATLERLIRDIDLEQTTLIYRAIQIAGAGGLGDVPKQDISQPPTQPIFHAMQLAASYDLIAQQYATGFVDVLNVGVPLFCEAVQHHDWERAIVLTFLQLLARSSDTLIQRKCGPAIAAECQERAVHVLRCCSPAELMQSTAFREFDDWLRADGNRRNPGSTADLMAAILFVTIRSQRWQPPAQLRLQVSN